MKENINYYYNFNTKFINKYVIEIDTERLKKLRIEIINNCSIISHKKYESIEEPNYFDIDHYRNYHSRKIGSIRTNDFNEPDKTLYLIEYDYYEHSKLIELIDKLLKGDTYIIDKLTDSSFLNIRKHYMDDQNLTNKINELIASGKYDEIKLLVDEEIETAQTRYNEILKLEQEYLQKINECIFLNLYDQIDLETFNDIKEFFDGINNHNVSKKLTKVLKTTNS